MTIINYKERANKTTESVLKKLKQLAKSKGVYITDINTWLVNNKCTVSIETDSPEWVSDTTKTLLNKTEFGMFKSSSEYEGRFDWKADTYIKPSVEIEFTV